MKNLKKLLCAFAALLMALFMPITAFAAEPTTGTITITNAREGQTYKAYQMMVLESYNAETNSYAYKINDAWKPFFQKGVSEEDRGPGYDYVEVNDQGYVTWKDGWKEDWKDDPKVAAFVKAAELYVRNNNLTATAEETAEEGETQVILTVPLGYYLTTSTVGTVCGLNTTKPNFEIEDKNVDPGNVKMIVEGASESSKNDATIGDTVTFKSTIDAKKGALNYKFVDTMDAGLTLNDKEGDVKVYLNGNLLPAADVDKNTKNYTKTVGKDDDGKTVMTITFTQTFCDTLVDEDEIVISYSAILNKDALVNTANVNESKLVYGNNPGTETTPSRTETYTWDFNVLKYGNGDENNTLAGAKFQLQKKDGTVIKFSKTNDNEYKVDPEGTVTEFTTDANGKFNLKGLDSGKYNLVELEAPAGFNKLSAPVEVEIKGADLTGTTVSYETFTQNVENKSGTELPSTGGMGTTLIYGAGAALVAGAGILLVTKKRMNKAE